MNQMPLVKIEIYSGKSTEYKKTLFDSIHDSLVESFRTPENDRHQKIYEIEPTNFDIIQSKSDKFTNIELTIFKGRSVEAQRDLYKTIVKKLNDSLEKLYHDLIG